MARLFDQKTKDQQTNSFAQYLPDGPLYEGKYIEEANLRKLIFGLSCELFRIEDMMGLISCDHDITQTTEFISQWKSAVGIPDECFPCEGTLEEQRNQVLLKFANMNAQTNDDFIRIAEVLGFEGITITPLQEQAYPCYSLPVYPTASPESRFVAVVKGEGIETGFPCYGVPSDVICGLQDVLQCVLNKLKPANVRLLFTDGKC